MSPSNTENPPPNQLTIDELFDVMSEETRRRVLYYIHERGSADVDELREHLSERTGDTVEIDITLYHKTLPKLDDLDVIDYDQQSEQVRYNGCSLTTELLEWTSEKEQTTGHAGHPDSTS